MENSVQTDVLFMDFSKAFDKVSHNLLTHKLYYYGMPGKNKNLDTYYITSYLIVHSLYYLKEKHQTETTCICTCNVWCATRLCYGPSLFLFYINDIPDGITSTICLFADDTIANLTIKSNRDCTTLQNDLDKLSIMGTIMENGLSP
jgi:hypothetical protein